MISGDKSPNVCSALKRLRSPSEGCSHQAKMISPARVFHEIHSLSVLLQAKDSLQKDNS
jgi:hypothetical protein